MKEIEIPFGASDSELDYQELIIPDGFEATIQDGKVILRKKESEEDEIRQALIKGFNECLVSSSHYPKNAVKYWHGIVIEDILAWLEKRKDYVSPQMVADAYLRGCNDTEKKWIEKQAERKTPRWMIDFLDNYRGKIGCSLDYDEARDVDGRILCIKEWLEKQGQSFPILSNSSKTGKKWTEEDEHHWMMCLECVEECATQKRKDFSKTISWLKQLKQRLEQ